MAISDGGVDASRLEVECSRRISERAVEERRGSAATVSDDIWMFIGSEVMVDFRSDFGGVKRFGRL